VTSSTQLGGSVIVTCRLASIEEMDLGLLSFKMFEFGCGARMLELFPVWGPVNNYDRAGVCSREDVDMYIIDWTRTYEDFGDVCNLVADFANGNPQAARKKWDSRKRLLKGSVNASVVLSGEVDVSGLPSRKKSARKAHDKVDEAANLEIVTAALKIMWDGSATAALTDNNEGRQERDQIPFR
jgi:hypothetical protein